MNTQEPWLILRRGQGQGYIIYARKGQGVSEVARVDDLDIARLIAKAPKLLRACQAVAAYNDSKYPANRVEAIRLVYEALSFTPEER